MLWDYHSVAKITNILLGLPCDENGDFLPARAPPSKAPEAAATDWSPYQSRAEFELAEFLYSREQMSAGNINTLLDLWAATLLQYGGSPPFTSAKDLYSTIDSTRLGEIKWESFSMSWQGVIPDRNPPPWMITQYDVWFRNPRDVIHNMLGNPDFDGEIDYAPLREFDGTTRRLKNFMSGDWAWNQAVSHMFASINYSLSYYTYGLGYYRKGCSHTWCSIHTCDTRK